MANIMGERKVIFSGLWRSTPRTDVDRQLRLISQEFQKKPGLPASFQIKASGVELYIISDNGLAGKNKRVEMKDIYDVIVNKYHPLCLMVVYSDSKNTHNFMVSQCYSETDGIQLTKVYRECKFKYGGRINAQADVNRKNWVLKQKTISNNNEGESESITSTERAESSNGDENRVVNTCDVNHDALVNSIDSTAYHCFMVHETNSKTEDEISNEESLPSQNGNADFDGESLVSIESYNSMKEELFNLSQEVRNIKLLLQHQGINPESIHQTSGQFNDHNNDSERPSPSSSPKSGASDRRVNFAVDESKGQGDSSRKGLYIKKQVSGKGKVSVRPHYYRTTSSGASVSSTSPGYVEPNDVFEYPQRVATHTAGPAHQKRGSQNAVATTIQKPIEEVYQMQPRKPYSHRRQIIIHPGKSSTLPALRLSADQDKGITPILKNGHH